MAIVEDQPGVTRDRFEREVEWTGKRFMLSDTGGWMPGGTELDAKVSQQVEEASATADLILFLVDTTIGVTDDDELIASWLRRLGRPVVVVANKVDSDKRDADRWDFLHLGFGDGVRVADWRIDQLAFGHQLRGGASSTLKAIMPHGRIGVRVV